MRGAGLGWVEGAVGGRVGYDERGLFTGVSSSVGSLKWLDGRRAQGAGRGEPSGRRRDSGRRRRSSGCTRASSNSWAPTGELLKQNKLFESKQSSNKSLYT